MKKLPLVIAYALLAFIFIVVVHNLIAPSADAWFDHDLYGNNNPYHKNWLGK